MPRLRRRDRIARWLGWSNAETKPESVLTLPAADGAQQQRLAARYFSHAEELIRRGAAEFSAPYYRQAYALLAASLGQPLPDEPPVSVVHLSPNAPSPDTTEPLKRIHSLRSALSATTAKATADEVERLRAGGVNHPDLDHLAGLTALLSKDTEQAEVCFRRALSASPRHYGSLVSLSGLLLARKDLDEAQRLLTTALAGVNPESPDAVPALTNLSLVHQGLGRRMDEALLLLKIHRLKPGHVLDQRLLKGAETLVEMGEEPAAIELFQWLSERPDGAAALAPLATLLERRGDYQAAALVYRRLLQPDGSDSTTVSG
jgi:tetratricopeptide (TPR) repeat protein